MLLWLALSLMQLDSRPSSVGMQKTVQALVLPGTELEAKPVDTQKSPLVLRIKAANRHGTAFRYDLEYHGLEPGTYDLRDYLIRKDNSTVADLPKLLVTIEPTLPPGQIQPHPPEKVPAPRLGGYRSLLLAGSILWILGLLFLLFGGRKEDEELEAELNRPRTLADRLRPLVEGAIAGSLSRPQRAELERMMLAFWRKKLMLEHRKPADAMRILRADPDAGKVVSQLEAWLHQPPGSAKAVDVSELLKPYQAMAPDALDQSMGKEPV